MLNGICTLANDYVFDQVVALINSIEANAGKSMPICIYPYDNSIERLQEFIKDRPQVQIFNDLEIIERWDSWTYKIWETHPSAENQWLQVNGKPDVHRMGTHRRFCAFSSPFERFIYMDADTVLLQPPNIVFQTLDSFDWVTYDFQYKDLSHVFTVTSHKLSEIFTAEQLKSQVFCSGFYGSKNKTVGEEEMRWYLAQLSQNEAEVLYPMAPDQTILNYFVLRKPINSVNLALTLPEGQRTGNSATSKHFEERNQKVFDKNIPLLYLHYIGISSKLFTRLCEGENLDIPYRETFLHYRFLHEPDKRPIFVGTPINPKSPKPSISQRLFRKLGMPKG